MIDVCRDEDMPDNTTVYRRMAGDPDFAANIARAREAQQDFEAENIIAIADAATVDDHQVAKLRIWARQWRASKLAPKKYGDKVTTEHTGKDGGPIETADMTTRDLTQRAIFLVAKAAKAK